MASNSKTLAELLNGDVTVTATDIADGAVSTAKIADDAVTVAKVADQVIGRKNLIINGAMQVWQRGTSSSSAGYQTADRFYHYTGNGLTHARSTDVPSGEGFTYSLSTTGTPSDEYNVGQSIELPADGEAGLFYNGQKITVSYWAKSSVAGDRLWNALFFRDSHASSSNQSTVDFDNTDNNQLTTSWVRYTKTYTIGVNPNGTNKSLTLQIRSRNSAQDSNTPGGNISITGVQLEVGDTTTPFEHRSYGEELALCQRYYWKLSADDSSGGQNYWGVGVGSGSQIVVPLTLPTEMREEPTLDASNNADDYRTIGDQTTTFDSFTLTSYSSRKVVTLGATVSVSAGDSVIVRGRQSGAYIAFDAEL